MGNSCGGAAPRDDNPAGTGEPPPAAVDAGVVDVAAAILASVQAQPYGVLGLSAGAKWQEVRRAPDPEGDMIIVDPASIRFIRDPQLWPADAGGASGAIYKFLGLSEEFPADVVANMQAVGDAAYHRYGYPSSYHVIHVSGPDFKTLQCARDQAVELLARCYLNVLSAAARVGKPRLRLVPIAAGIFAGPHAREMPEITAEALVHAVERLASSDAELAKALLPVNLNQDGAGLKALELCLWEGELAAAAYGRALASALKARAGRGASTGDAALGEAPTASGTPTSAASCSSTAAGSSTATGRGGEEGGGGDGKGGGGKGGRGAHQTLGARRRSAARATQRRGCCMR